MKYVLSLTAKPVKTCKEQLLEIPPTYTSTKIFTTWWVKKYRKFIFYQQEYRHTCMYL